MTEAETEMKIRKLLQTLFDNVQYKEDELTHFMLYHMNRSSYDKYGKYNPGLF